MVTGNALVHRPSPITFVPPPSPFPLHCPGSHPKLNTKPESGGLATRESFSFPGILLSSAPRALSPGLGPRTPCLAGTPDLSHCRAAPTPHSVGGKRPPEEATDGQLAMHCSLLQLLNAAFMDKNPATHTHECCIRIRLCFCPVFNHQAYSQSRMPHSQP